MRSEKQIERKLIQAVKARGGQCYKWVSPGRRGVPDRICALPGKRLVFVEVKANRLCRLSKLQARELMTLKIMGFDVAVVYDEIGIRNLMYAIDRLL